MKMENNPIKQLFEEERIGLPEGDLDIFMHKYQSYRQTKTRRKRRLWALIIIANTAALLLIVWNFPKSIKSVAPLPEISTRTDGLFGQVPTIQVQPRFQQHRLQALSTQKPTGENAPEYPQKQVIQEPVRQTGTTIQAVPQQSQPTKSSCLKTPIPVDEEITILEETTKNIELLLSYGFNPANQVPVDPGTGILPMNYTPIYYGGKPFTEEHRIYGSPLSFDVQIRFLLSQRWSLNTGLRYTFLRSSTYQDNVLVSKEHSHLIGIPVLANFNLTQSEHLETYLSGGMIPEWCIKSDTGAELEQRFLLSAELGIGGAYKISPTISLYLEPSIHYCFQNIKFKTFEKKEGFSLALHVGFRFLL